MAFMTSMPAGGLSAGGCPYSGGRFDIRWMDHLMNLGRLRVRRHRHV